MTTESNRRAALADEIEKQVGYAREADYFVADVLLSFGQWDETVAVLRAPTEPGTPAPGMPSEDETKRAIKKAYPSAGQTGDLRTRDLSDAASVDLARAILALVRPRFEALAAENERLKEGLRPFARIAELDDAKPDGASTMVNVNLCRRAASLLGGQDDGR